MIVDGKPWLRVLVPVVSKAGSRVASLKGIFAFSADAIADFRLRGVRTMAIVILVVLLTAAVTYPIVRRLLGQVTDFSVRLLDANLDVLATLGSAIAKRDSDTHAHNYRVTIYAVRLAEAVGVPPPTIRSLIKGAFLHDVGKIGIPDGILLKPGKLDDAEYALMKTHVEHGRDIVSRSRWLQDAMDVVYAHHEQVEGRGYPRGLAGSDIPVTARMFAIADVFDALTSRRPYKEPWSFEKAMEILAKGAAPISIPSCWTLSVGLPVRCSLRLFGQCRTPSSRPSSGLISTIGWTVSTPDAVGPTPSRHRGDVSTNE